MRRLLCPGCRPARVALLLLVAAAPLPAGLLRSLVFLLILASAVVGRLTLAVLRAAVVVLGAEFLPLTDRRRTPVRSRRRACRRANKQQLALFPRLTPCRLGPLRRVQFLIPGTTPSSMPMPILVVLRVWG